MKHRIDPSKLVRFDTAALVSTNPEECYFMVFPLTNGDVLQVKMTRAEFFQQIDAGRKLLEM